jgi:hypothetical protein
MKTKWLRSYGLTKQWTVYQSSCGQGEIRKLPHYFVLTIRGKRVFTGTFPECKEFFQEFKYPQP